MHPVDHVQQLLVDGAMKVWENKNKQAHLTRERLVPITQEFPDFGTDLAVTVLKTPQLLFCTHCGPGLDCEQKHVWVLVDELGGCVSWIRYFLRSGHRVSMVVFMISSIYR
jgi:hypothetical protein